MTDWTRFQKWADGIPVVTSETECAEPHSPRKLRAESARTGGNR